MKVFISWSGQTSHQVALVFRDWLPKVVQSLQPYVSSEDIDKGARWSTDIAQELNESGYGIICITPDNVGAPWINFEAGALSKSFDASRVSPFLFGVARKDLTGPTLQFQSTIFEKPDVLKLVKSLNAACETLAIDDSRLGEIFDVFWPILEAAMANVPPAVITSANDAKARTESEILEELLELVRAQSRLLNSPHELLPAGYIVETLERSRFSPMSGGMPLDGVIHDLLEYYAEAIERADMKGPPEIVLSALLDGLERFEGPLDALAERSGLGRRRPSSGRVRRLRRKWESEAPIRPQKD